MLRVLGRSTSGNVQKVIWLLEELGSVPYRREDYGRQFNNTSDAAYLRLNPNGKVPTLVDGELAVWESNTILRYLCNRYGGEAFYPGDAARRSFIERWMDWQLAALYAPYVAIFKEAKKPAAERAASFGIDVRRLRLGTLLRVSALSALAVSFVGTIGFVGLVVGCSFLVRETRLALQSMSDEAELAKSWARKIG